MLFIVIAKHAIRYINCSIFHHCTRYLPTAEPKEPPANRQIYDSARNHANNAWPIGGSAKGTAARQVAEILAMPAPHLRNPPAPTAVTSTYRPFIHPTFRKAPSHSPHINQY